MISYALAIFFALVLWVLLADRKIGPGQFTWWAVQSIAVAMFVTGKLL